MRQIWWALLRLVFRLLYREMAGGYDLVSRIVSLGHWRDWQRAAMHYAHGPRLLDLAFGTGNLLLDWRAAGARAVGVDLSPQMVRIAARKLRVRGLPLILAQGQAQALPFADATFDSVVSTFPAEFILERVTVEEVARVLRPGGRFVVVANAYLTGRDLPSRFLEWLYTVTAQRPNLPPAEELVLPDRLAARWERVKGDSWVAMVLVGEKRKEGERERVMTEGGTGRRGGEENRASSQYSQVYGASLSDQSHTGQTSQAPSRRRGGWKTKLLILGGLIALLGWVSITWAVSVNRHEASTYGIADPSSAALRVENRTTDFAITRVSIEEPERSVTVQDVGREIGPSAEAVLEIAPGAYLVKVFYVEISQAVPDRPQGFLSGTFSVSPGKATVLHLQGGRSSPESFIFIPPELAFK
jgi:ubiquinone/menaquinone biosynthesis C-methylase UbiE